VNVTEPNGNQQREMPKNQLNRAEASRSIRAQSNWPRWQQVSDIDRIWTFAALLRAHPAFCLRGCCWPDNPRCRENTRAHQHLSLSPQRSEWEHRTLQNGKTDL